MVQVVITLDDNGQISLQANANRFTIYGMIEAARESLFVQAAKEAERLVQLAPGPLITGKN